MYQGRHITTYSAKRGGCSWRWMSMLVFFPGRLALDAVLIKGVIWRITSLRAGQGRKKKKLKKKGKGKHKTFARRFLFGRRRCR